MVQNAMEKMMAITAAMVGELRAKTDAPMMECKKALTEANGDMEKAEEILRVKLGNKAGKAASRVTAEGVVASAIDGKVGALIEVNCETDFVTKNDSFLALCSKAADLIAKHNPADIEALGGLPCEIDGFGPTLEDARKGLIGKIGENMSFRRFKRVEGSSVTCYLHSGRIGVMVEFEGSETAARDVAMHIAAMKPVALSSADVPAELVAKERSVAEAKAAESGKPAEIVTKMVEGSIAKYLKEVSLMDQAFVKNDKQTIAQMLKENSTTVSAFTMYIVGEGIEKKVDDFAAEVAAQVAAAKSA
jgi:elongation factor Ts